MAGTAELVGEVRQAMAILEAHVRGLDGRCRCGARRACEAYEQASAVLAERQVLPRRRPGAARADLLRRMSGLPDGCGIAAV